MASCERSYLRAVTIRADGRVRRSDVEAGRELNVLGTHPRPSGSVVDNFLPYAAYAVCVMPPVGSVTFVNLPSAS